MLQVPQIAALARTLSAYQIGLQDLFAFFDEIRPGYYHFSDGTFFPEPLDGRVIDGIFLNQNLCIRMVEAENISSWAGAIKHCRNRGFRLPTRKEKLLIDEALTTINIAAKKVGASPVSGSYWLEDENPGECETRKVRGVFSVQRCRPALKVAVTDSSNDSVFVLLAKMLNVEPERFFDYLAGRLRVPKAGDMLMRDGSFSENPLYDSEIGIFINANQFIPLENLPKKLFTLQEARAFCRENSFLLPTYRDICRLMPVVEKVNRTFECIGMQRHCLPENVFAEFWYTELAEKSRDPEEQHRLIYFSHKSFLPGGYIVLKDIYPFLGVND